jgi:enterochelin esterase-like enzyme
MGATALPISGQAQRSRAWRLRIGALLSALAAACVAATLGDPGAIERLASLSAGAGAPAISVPPAAAVVPPPDLLAPAPTLLPVTSDAAGSSIYWTRFASSSLDAQGSFFVYLPAGYANATRRYPVLYLLHGRNGHASAFLEIGIQKSLDQLISDKAIPPMIVVMIQDRPGLNNWRDLGRQHSETYVVEVQELVDRMLRTIPTRSARAIAGSSIGGFGAMNVALSNPLRFAVVESWLGFFNNLEGALRADQPVISRLGLHAFLYGAAEDPVAVPAEDPEFAGELRAAGAQAQSAIYPGGHSLEKIREHLATGLLFAGRSLMETQQRAAAEEAQRRAAAEAAQRRAQSLPAARQ